MFEDVAAMEKEIDTFRKNVVASSELIEEISSLTTATRQQKEDFSKRSAEILNKLDKCILQFKADHETALAALSKENAESLTAMEEKLAAEQDACVSQMKEIQKSIEKCAADSGEKSDQQLQKLHEECARLIDQMQTAFQTAQDSFVSETEKVRGILEQTEAATKADADRQLARLTNESERMLSQLQTAVQVQQETYIAEMQASAASIKEYQASAEKNYEDFKKTLQDTTLDQILNEVRDIKKNVQTKFMILLGGVGVTLVIAILGLILK